MQSIYSTLVRKENLRRLFAAVFLLFMLVEWGSHMAMHSYATSAHRSSVSSHEDGQEDPCRTLILCSDSKRERQQLPNPVHQMAQHNALLELLASIRPLTFTLGDPPIPFGRAEAVFRPMSPPFHPPELS
jgi:hypothetical protein